MGDGPRAKDSATSASAWFEPAVATWLAGLGLVRDAVRQELVRRQLAVNLPTVSEPLDVLDAGCGQGTQAIELARAGGCRATRTAWFGVRLFTDHWGPEEPGDDFAQLLAVEEEAGRRDPYRALAALTRTIARVC